jgi:hypothetical protein
MRLLNTYKKLQNVLGDQIEPFETVELIEAYRQYFKPEVVNVILLAESHVYTTKSDADIQIPHIDELPNYPTKYAKFVYCLGYGERQLTKSPFHPKRDGTPQFWKIFTSCITKGDVSGSFAQVQSSTPTNERIKNKIEVLLKLKENGIWLVDMSIAALYHRGKKLKNMDEALLVSWENYTRDIVFNCNPNHVICVGKGIARIAEADLRSRFFNNYSAVAQPNAFLTSNEHLDNYQHYSNICNPIKKG